MVVIESTSDDRYANSTSDDSDQQDNTIRIPVTSTENRNLKCGHSEDDNADIAYLNFPLLIPSSVFTVVSFGCFLAAVVISLRSDYVPTDQELLRGYVAKYGSSRFQCWPTTAPFPADGLPSVLNLFEMNVVGNVLFRYSVGVPIIIRVFHAITIRNLVRYEYGPSFSNLHKVAADSMPLFTSLETLSIALFSIITVHEDFPEANRFFKIIFAMTSVVNMLATSLVMFHLLSSSDQILDNVSICFKCICSAVYAYFMPQYIQFHQSSITFPLCHSYLPRMFALIEYGIILSYALFHLSILIDIRHISFVCFPRSSSGECEPIHPSNFTQGAKYEHCRAFEYNQRRIMSI